jgi:lipopolysaccharide export system protein LptC
MEIEQPQIRSYDERGALTVATAKRGISNGDGSQVQLIGDAVVTREGPNAKGEQQPRLEIRGEFLQAFLDREQVKSHLPVTLVRGRDVFQGDSLDYDNLERVLQLQGRVRGTLQAQQAPR